MGCSRSTSLNTFFQHSQWSRSRCVPTTLYMNVWAGYVPNGKNRLVWSSSIRRLQWLLSHLSKLRPDWVLGGHELSTWPWNVKSVITQHAYIQQTLSWSQLKTKRRGLLCLISQRFNFWTDITWKEEAVLRSVIVKNHTARALGLSDNHVSNVTFWWAKNTKSRKFQFECASGLAESLNTISIISWGPCIESLQHSTHFNKPQSATLPDTN